MPDHNQHTSDGAKGRWPEVLRALGVDEKVLNRKPQACPMCGGDDRFTFTDRSGEGDYVCRHCGAGKGMKLLMGVMRWDWKTAADHVDVILGTLPASRRTAPKPARNISMADLRALWASGREITPEDPAGAYLRARGLRVEGLEDVARFVPALPHYATQTRHPGMVAKFRDVAGETRQLQRTYLTEHGAKADVTPNRMFMPRLMPVGGAIRLGQPAARMGVAEGLETAMAAAQRFGVVVWATTSEVLLQKWLPPAEATRIIVFADNDSNFVGQHAAFALAKRLVFEARRDGIEREVEVRIPEKPDTDWADQQ